jgi:hypothetical protein
MPSEFTVRADSVDVEQIMGRIRARIREKRGVEYTEAEILELANVKIETFLDPTRVRSDLLEHYLKTHKVADPGAAPSAGLSGRMAGGLRRVFSPVLNVFGKLTTIRHAFRELRLNFVLIHNLVVELTRLAVEVRNLKMRVESLSSRLDFSERRARAMEHVVQYRPGTAPAAESARASAAPESRREPEARREPESRREPENRREPNPGEAPVRAEAQRRRRRRRRSRGGEAAGAGQLSLEGGEQAGATSEPAPTQPASSEPSVPDRDTPDQ